MVIDMYTTEKGGKISIAHDLNFQQSEYENIHTITFKNPSQALQQLLRETGPLPSDEERKQKKAVDGGSKKKRPYDIERMADGLTKLGEDDLLQVIQMIHDHKDDNTYIQNNLDGKLSFSLARARAIVFVGEVSGSDANRAKKSIAGEFSVDLYTLPDNLMKMLWEFLVSFRPFPSYVEPSESHVADIHSRSRPT